MDEQLSALWQETTKAGAETQEERLAARRMAESCGLEFQDMDDFRIDNDLFRSIPFDLMLRYDFVPQEQLRGRLAVVVIDSFSGSGVSVARASRTRSPWRASSASTLACAPQRA